MADSNRLVRSVEYFSNDTEVLVGEFILPDDLELSQLQKLWNLPLNEPMYHCFEISDQQVPFFKALLGIEFDFVRYCYFLSAYTTTKIMKCDE